MRACTGKTTWRIKSPARGVNSPAEATALAIRSRVASASACYTGGNAIRAVRF